MVLSRKYVARLIAGWGLFGGAAIVVGASYIGGAATFFLLTALASWTVFPLIHFSLAALVARKSHDDPTFALSLLVIASVLCVLGLLLASGVFNYV